MEADALSRIAQAGCWNGAKNVLPWNCNRAVAKKLVDDPRAVLAVIPPNIARLRGQIQGESARSWLNEWEQLAQLGSIGGLVDVMIGTDRRSIDMRQSSPFLGVLSQAERIQASHKARRV
ncbi:MAG: hypothetical protein WDM88_10450 [Galbitalea sp.]